MRHITPIFWAVAGSLAVGTPGLAGVVDYDATQREVRARAASNPAETMTSGATGAWDGLAADAFDDDEGNRGDALATQLSDLSPIGIRAAGRLDAFGSTDVSALGESWLEAEFSLAGATPVSFAGVLTAFRIDDAGAVQVLVELRDVADNLLFRVTQDDLAIPSSGSVGLPGFAAVLAPGSYALRMILSASGFEDARNTIGYDLAWALPAPGSGGVGMIGLGLAARRRRRDA